jgi:DNA (cytosine-5)-methyltransferase 1
MAKPSVISIFSGAGGLDYGFEAAGFDTVVAVEMDHACCETLRANRRWPVIERDIFQVSSKEILATAGLKNGDAAVLIGGPPCQPFSKAGYWSRGDARRLDDPRANTLKAYLRVLEDVRPHVFVLENVEGLAYRGKDEGLRYIVEAIDGINRRARTKYRPVVQILNAADYGVPQIRKRLVMIGSRDGTEFKFPPPTHGDPQLGLFCDIAPRRTAWDAIADLVIDPGEDVAASGRWADLLPSIPEGNNYLWHTNRGGGLPLFGWRRRYWSFLLKLAKNQPSWTVQAQPGPGSGPFHWDNRRLSMRELCRLQTLPDDVVVSGSRLAIQRQIGNAVPSLLGELIARAIRVQLLGLRAAYREPKLLPPYRGPAPSAAEPSTVPEKYLSMIGAHTPHPGIGYGNSALLRAQHG